MKRNIKVKYEIRGKLKLLISQSQIINKEC
jgi:hypothetical protein